MIYAERAQVKTKLASDPPVPPCSSPCGLKQVAHSSLFFVQKNQPTNTNRMLSGLEDFAVSVFVVILVEFDRSCVSSEKKTAGGQNVGFPPLYDRHKWQKQHSQWLEYQSHK